MVFISEGQALLCFHMLFMLHHQLPPTALLLLLPLFIKMLVFLSRAKRHGMYQTGISAKGGKQDYAEVYRDTEIGSVIIKGDESLIRQFDHAGLFGAEKPTQHASSIRKYAQTAPILAAALLHLITTSVFLVSTDWQARDIIPWVWTLQQAIALFAATVIRISGYANFGCMEQRLGAALAKEGKVIFWGKDYLGVEARLEVGRAEKRERTQDIPESKLHDELVAMNQEVTKLSKESLAHVDSTSIPPCCDICDTSDSAIATARSNSVAGLSPKTSLRPIEELRQELAGWFKVRFKSASSDRDEEGDVEM
jgi:hypothetical protein